ncbi:MAG: Lrp/AsnC family transcriptional regulator [Candidatus Hermodarchaeota archaeon]
MIDKQDFAILNELQQDASQSALSISRKVKMPRSTVQHRIERMKANRIIKRVVAVPDYAKIGLPVTAFVLVNFLPTSGLSQQDVARSIARLENVVEVHVVAGQWDIILKARGVSLKEIGELVVNQLREIPGVGQTVTSGSFFVIKEDP